MDKITLVLHKLVGFFFFLCLWGFLLILSLIASLFLSPLVKFPLKIPTMLRKNQRRVWVWLKEECWKGNLRLLVAGHPDDSFKNSQRDSCNLRAGEEDQGYIPIPYLESLLLDFKSAGYFWTMLIKGSHVLKIPPTFFPNNHHSAWDYHQSLTVELFSLQLAQSVHTVSFNSVLLSFVLTKQSIA